MFRKIIKYTSYLMNCVFALLLALFIDAYTIEDFKKVSSFVNTRLTELQADCIIRETAVGIKRYGTGRENRKSVQAYVTQICGTSPFHVMPSEMLPTDDKLKIE